MLPTLKLRQIQSFLIKSRMDLFPLTFTNSFAFFDLPSEKNVSLKKTKNDGFRYFIIFILYHFLDEYFILILIKNGKLYKYHKNIKLGPIVFQIEESKVLLTPFAVSKDGTHFFCCDNYISELVDTGTDIICRNETIYFIFNSFEKIGKYINFEQGLMQNDRNSLKKTDSSFLLKELEIKNVCYYYFVKNVDVLVLITKNCSFLIIS